MVKMPLKWRKERGAYYEDMIRRAISRRHDIIAKREKFRELYNREPGGFDATTPFDGASNIHLPIIMEKVETATPKVVSAMWRAEPFVNVRRPNGMTDTKMAKNVELFSSWAFRNDIPDFYLSFENFNRNRFIDGTAFAKIRWTRKWRRTIETHTLASKVKYGPELPEVDRSADELFKEIFSLGDPDNSMYKVKPLKGKNRFEVKFIEGGLPFTAECRIEEGEKMNEVVVKVHRNVIKQDSPSIDNVDIEDLLFPERSKSLQTADWVAHKTWRTIDEIKRLNKKGTWTVSKADFEYMEGVKSKNDPEVTGELNKDIVAGEHAETGMERTTADGMVDPNRVLVWELYTQEYVDGNEDPIDVIMHILDDRRVIIGIEYHDEVFPHGRRPFISDTYIPIDGRIWGIGMAEVLYGINLSLNKTINDVNNGMTIKTNPWFLYSIFGMAENDQLLRGIQPGEGIPVGDVNQVKFPDFAQEPAAMFHASFETLRGYADQLTFSPSAGGSNNYRNAPRTARGTMALMDAAEEKLSSLVEQSQATSWKEMVSQVISLYGHYVGVDKWYYITGEANPRRISPKELREQYQYEFSGSLTSVNRDVQRSLIERLYTTARTDPGYQQDPDAANALLRRYVEGFIDVGDAEPLIPKKPGMGGMPHPAWDQDTELHALAAGQHIEVLPSDDHNRHLKDIEKFKKAEVYQMLDARAVAMIDVHEMGHKQAMQQAIQQQQQMTPPGQGQGTPGGQDQAQAAQGIPSLGGEMSALEGGPQ